MDTALPDPAALLADAGDDGAADVDDAVAVDSLLALVAEVGFMKLREALGTEAEVVPLRPFRGLPGPPFDRAVDVIVIPVMLDAAAALAAAALLPSVTLKKAGIIII